MNDSRSAFRTRLATSGPVLVALLALVGCASGPVWRGWPEASQKQYFGLRCIAGDSALAGYRSQPDQEAMNAWYRAYWASDHDGVGSAEHQGRLEYAWSTFGGTRCFHDDRARIYVQYGKPADRWTSREAWQYLNSKQLAGGPMYRHRPWEVWQYPDQGLYYDFIEFNDAHRIWATLLLDRRHPIAYFRACSSAVRSAPEPGSSSAAGPLDLSWARFKSKAPGRIRWELYWRVPAAAGTGGPVCAAFTITDEAGQRTGDTVWYDAVLPAGPLPEPYVFGQRAFDLRPGRYQMAVALSGGMMPPLQASADAELISYRPGVQECSDVELAVLQDTTPISPDFEKGKFKRVIPSVVPVLPTRQPYFIYYEVYNLKTNAAGDHDVSVKLQVFQAGADTIKERPFAIGEFSDRDSGQTYRGCYCVYPRDLGRGEVSLLINIEDRQTGRASRVIKTFRLQE
jgi:hypothetical protein